MHVDLVYLQICYTCKQNLHNIKSSTQAFIMYTMFTCKPSIHINIVYKYTEYTLIYSFSLTSIHVRKTH